MRHSQLRFSFSRFTHLAFALVGFLAGGAPHGLLAADAPKVGDHAPDFSLTSLAGTPVRLSEATSHGTVVLVVLRGWPGYQCPICDRQVNEFVSAQAAFASAKARLIFVYPGPAADLQAHAAEFKSWKGREWPEHFGFVLDPDYEFTNAYGLRWDAPRETAYPSTFILDTEGIVKFAKISRSHGDRTKAADILAALKSLQSQ